MSLKNNRDKDNKSVTKLTNYSRTHNDSFSRDSDYEEQFTLMIKPTHNQINTKRDNCLAMKIAVRYPPKIRDEVVKMVDYYEDVIQNQTYDYHKLVQQNHRLRRQNQELSAQILRSELTKESRTPTKKTQTSNNNYNQILKSSVLNKVNQKQTNTPLKVVIENKGPLVKKNNQSPKFADKKQIGGMVARQIKTKGRQNMPFRNF